MPPVTYFTVTNARFFVGSVALVNSLRLMANDGEICVLDLGLTPTQRRRLSPHATLVESPADLTRAPTVVKAFPRSLRRRGVAVAIDGDMLVTASLREIVEAAASGHFCAFSEVEGDCDRWFAEWQPILGLRCPPRRQPYVNAGLLAFSADRWPSFWDRWWDLCARIAIEQTRLRDAEYDSPLWAADQDALNALLMSEIPAEALHVLRQARAPHFQQLSDAKVIDEDALRCSYAGVDTTLLHATGSPKPWEREAWMQVRANAYERLMPRVLFAPDVPLRMDPTELPIWTRPGVAGRVTLRSLATINAAARQATDRASGRTRQRLLALRRTLTHARGEF